ncbi:MAG: helix-turn-helix transcriptional regulator [Crinalium sp.]
MAMEVLLRQVRDERKLSLNDLARLTGLSPQQIQRIETGASWLSKNSTEQLCKALKCQPGDLLRYVPDAGSD